MARVDDDHRPRPPDRRPAELLQGSRQGARRRAARDVEGLPATARRSTASRRTCRRALRRRASTSTAGRCRARRRCSRAGSAGSPRPKPRWATCSARLYVEKYFPPEAKAPHGRARRQPAEGVRRAHRRARVDEARDAARRRTTKLATFTVKIGYPEKWRDYSALEIKPRRPGRQRACARARSNVERELAQARQAGRPDRVGHDAADGQRLLQPARERDRVPGRDPAAAVLRPGRRRRGQLRRHRRRDRPRDQPRLRRPGPQVRRRGRAARLVDGRGRRALRGARRRARRRSTTRSARCPA